MSFFLFGFQTEVSKPKKHIKFNTNFTSLYAADFQDQVLGTGLNAGMYRCPHIESWECGGVFVDSAHCRSACRGVGCRDLNICEARKAYTDMVCGMWVRQISEVV